MNIPIKKIFIFVTRKQLLLEYLALIRNLILKKCLHQICIFRCSDVLAVASFGRKTLFVSNELKFWALVKPTSYSLIPRISTFFNQESYKEKI